MKTFRSCRMALTCCLGTALAVPVVAQIYNLGQPTTQTATQAAPLNAPAVTVSDILAGKSIPLALKIGDLQQGWQQFTIDGQQDSLVDFVMLVSSGEPDPSQLIQTFYTNGQTIASAGESYLVVYQRPRIFPKQGEGRSSYRSRHSGPSMETQLARLLTADTPLTLSLLNLSAAGNLMNIRPFNLQAELTASAKDRERLIREDKQAQRQQSVGHLTQLGHMIRAYAQRHKGVLPSMGSYEKLNNAIDYTPGEMMEYDEPAMPMPTAETPETPEITYATNPTLSQKKLAAFHDQSWIPTVYEAQMASDGTRGVLFLNGAVKRISEAEWRKLKRAAKIP